MAEVGIRGLGRRWAALPLAAAVLLGCSDDGVQPVGDAIDAVSDSTSDPPSPDITSDSVEPLDSTTSSDTDASSPACAPPVAGWAPGPGVWGNVQHPPVQLASEALGAEPVYGQLWLEGRTESAGAAAGVRADLLVGPLGTLPGEACWQAVEAGFNVDAGNNDEYVATPPAAPGVHGLVYRFDLDDGRQVYGDIDGSDDGIQRGSAAALHVPAPSAAVTLMTLNIRCQADDWPAREPLVHAALAEADADVIALQEDCQQSASLRAAVASALERGYALIEASTHVAEHDGETFSEGIALLTRHAVGDVDVLDLETTHFPRKAIAAELIFQDRPSLRVYATHYDFGVGSVEARLQSSLTLLAHMASHPDDDVAVLGDLNAAPDSTAVQALTAQLTDAWSVNPGASGATIPSDAPNRRIDYILTSPSLGDVVSTRLIDNAADGVFLSDHLGIVTRVVRR